MKEILGVGDSIREEVYTPLSARWAQFVGFLKRFFKIRIIVFSVTSNKKIVIVVNASNIKVQEIEKQ